MKKENVCKNCIHCGPFCEKVDGKELGNCLLTMKEIDIVKEHCFDFSLDKNHV